MGGWKKLWLFGLEKRRNRETCGLLCRERRLPGKRKVGGHSGLSSPVCTALRRLRPLPRDYSTFSPICAAAGSLSTFFGGHNPGQLSAVVETMWMHPCVLNNLRRNGILPKVVRAPFLEIFNHRPSLEGLQHTTVSFYYFQISSQLKASSLEVISPIGKHLDIHVNDAHWCSKRLLSLVPYSDSNNS